MRQRKEWNVVDAASWTEQGHCTLECSASVINCVKTVQDLSHQHSTVGAHKAPPIPG